MKNGQKSVYILLALFMIAIATLFSWRLLSTFSPHLLTSSALSLQADNFQGSSVEKDALSFTLSFEQHQMLISSFSKALPFKAGTPLDTKVGFSEIYLYRFNAPPLVVEPVGYENNNLVFSSSDWEEGALFVETSDGLLRASLQQAVE